MHVAAPPDAVWALVSDIQLPARFSAEFDGAEWLDGATGPRSALASSAQPAPGDRQWETTSTVSAFEPGHVRLGRRRSRRAVGDVAIQAASEGAARG